MNPTHPSAPGQVAMSTVHNEETPPLSKQVPEHSRAEEIRRQVEYYFSDSNLATDDYLGTLCAGAQNQPVSLNEILGWKRMRQYRPKELVIEALKKSPVLEIIDDSKSVRRRNPYQPSTVDDDTPIATFPKAKPMVSEEDYDGTNLKEGYEVRRGIITRISGKAKATAACFEDCFDEDPVEPAEALEETDLYGPDVLLCERLQTGLDRYYTRRKFAQKSRDIFDKFMTFGCVSSSPVTFSGHDKHEIKGMDPHLKARMFGLHNLPEDMVDKSKFEVDFLGVAKSYLGGVLPQEADFKTITQTCKVLVSFYNYFIMHGICNEFYDQLVAARNLVDNIAETELRMVRHSMQVLPGRFNAACNHLFKGTDNAPENFPSDSATDDNEIAKNAFTNTEVAKLIVIQALVALGSDDLAAFALETNNIPSVVSIVEKISGAGFEITSIIKPTSEIASLYASMATDSWAQIPLGIVQCKYWDNNFFESYDFPKGVSARCKLQDSITFWIEETIISQLKEGMKFEADVKLINFAGHGALWVLDYVPKVYPSFYEPTLNELAPKKIKLVKLKDLHESDSCKKEIDMPATNREES